MNRLLQLVDELVEAVERRESAEPDLAAWEAEADIRRIQRQLVLEYRQVARIPVERADERRLVATH
jgi:uncharacterized protein Yka (UPF0111/DUF47 family)